MSDEPTLVLAFLAGLSGAGHCWSMCGGLVGGAFLACAGPGHRAWPHLGYHAGRVLAYTLWGGLAAALGQAIVLTGGVGRTQGVLYMLAGLLVSLGGLRVMGVLPHSRMENGPGRGGSARIIQFGKERDSASPLRGQGPANWPIAGFLNGLMPCSLVFSLTLKAATAPSLLHGAGWLFAFGLGTVPAMLLAGMLAHGLGVQSRIWLPRVAGVAVFALGVQALIAGAGFFRVMLHL